MTAQQTNTDVRPGTRRRKRKKRFAFKLILFLTVLVASVCILLDINPLETFRSLTQHEIAESKPTENVENDVKGDGSVLLMLVNPWNPIPDSFTPELTTLSDGQQIASCCCEDLEKMLSDCRSAGNSPYICSAYRTQETQEYLFGNKVGRLIAEGFDEKTAETEAAKVVALPGTSEHQLGLAADIIDSTYTQLDNGQENTSTQKWLMENSWKYGFILRYPSGKSDITGIIYEPWHYRYVGAETAAEIYESGLCLEEYLEKQ